ncbi:YoaK family protein [Corynebacterium auriscanis]|uniref:YoaK family protein n=1 Tax=Corynebacterium auriscanis TaxID=99807 RepID=UPI0024AC8629|nr:YoaK family protein [Corynebacterium auriscanis]
MSPSTFFRQARETVLPVTSNPHGPLPPLLLAWTVVTGLVDAYSYLQLNHVFVANMTGNVVFLGFSFSGVPGFAWWASLLAIVAFMAGAKLGGGFAHVRKSRHRGSLLFRAGMVQMLFFAASALLAFVLPPSQSTASLVMLVIVLSVAMGLQNSIARELSVPDLTTTVLTLTITGLASDGEGSRKTNNAGRRVLSIMSMALGALVGGAMVHVGTGYLALLIAVALTAVITWRAFSFRNVTAEWARLA